MRVVAGLVLLLTVAGFLFGRADSNWWILQGDRERLAGRPDEARRNYLRAKDYSNWRAWARLGSLAVSQGQLEDASAWFEQAHHQRPGEPEILLPFADVLIKLRRLPQAQQLLRECLASSPGRAEALTLMARLSLARGDVAASRRWAAHLLALNPSSQVARQLLAQAAESGGQWRLAAAEYVRAVGTLPATDGAMHFNAAVCLVKAQDPAGALQQVTRALELNPQILGGYLLAHDLSGDRRFLEALVRVAPASPEAGMARGRL